MTVQRTFKYFWLRFLRQKDTPHRIALGIAIGMFINFTPYIGLHTLMGLGLLLFLPGNRFATLATIWTNTPWTVPMLLAADYKIGAWLLGSRIPWSKISFTSMDAFFKTGGDLFWSINAGGAILGVSGAILSYGLARPLIKRYQHNRRKVKIFSADQ